MNNIRGNNERGRQFTPTLPNYTIKTFKEDIKDLIAKEAEVLAKRLKDEKDVLKECNKNSQIRKFYDELSFMESTCKTDSDFDKQLPNIYIIASKAAYANGRKLISKTLYEFIKINIVLIKSRSDLQKFLLYFEAVLGFYRFFNPKEHE